MKSWNQFIISKVQKKKNPLKESMVSAFYAFLDSTQGVGVGGAWVVIPK